MSGAVSARSAPAQVVDLLWLRWTMLGGWARVVLTVAVTLGVASGPLAFALGAWVGPQLPTSRQVEVTELVGGTFLVVAVGIVVAAVTSSGGRELIPRQHLSAFPVGPAAEHLAALLLAPANIAWLLQVAGTFMVTGIAAAFTAAGDGRALLVGGGVTMLVTAAWVLSATTIAQVLAWLAELVRTVPGGHWVLRALVLLGGVLVVRSADVETLTSLLNWSFTRDLTARALDAVRGGAVRALLDVAILTAITVGAGWLGAVAYRFLSRRPTRDQSRTETATHPARRLPAQQAPAADLRAWCRQDWAAIWRSVPLRRGLIVLVAGPVFGGVMSRVAWNDLALFTGVVAAGGGLLFGVNAFCLDAEGAAFRDNLPVPPRLWITARALVLGQVVLGTCLLATVAAATTARHVTVTALITAVAGVVGLSAQVVSRCLRWSVRHPERAELRTTRDSPASAGRMVGYSARLVGANTGLAVVLSVAARWDRPLVSVIVVAVVMVASALSIRRSLREFDDPVVRATIVQTVARG